MVCFCCLIDKQQRTKQDIRYSDRSVWRSISRRWLRIGQLIRHDSLVHTQTDSKGTFSLNVDEDGLFLLKFSCLGYQPQQLTCKSGDVGMVKLTENIQNLSEVTVSGQGLRSFGNADIILLDRRARQVGNNALEAISNLPQFRLSTNSGELLNGRW